MPATEQHAASFRDPAGFLFSRDGILYRQINRAAADDYSRLISSGLYDKLVKSGLLISHAEVDVPAADAESVFKIIQPDLVPFISYPYEWCFSELKDAALATLSIQRRALKNGMSLKDASAYNIQFIRGKATLIDTLSFAIYQDGKPWDAYRQFCSHFLAPLALMAHLDVRLNQLLRVYIDGVPLDLASRLLPARTRVKFGLLTHIHVHSGAQRRFAGGATPARGARMSQASLLALIENLESTVRKLTWTPRGTEWDAYYENSNYSDAAFKRKLELITEWTAELKPKMVWDLGANTGVFSRAAAGSGAHVIAFDLDSAAVEQNYLEIKKQAAQNILPLILDLTNPSPALGWDHRERHSFAERGPADLALALALVHHLAISNNVPLPHLADFFAARAPRLAVEFVPKTDSQVARLLRSRADIFPSYTRAGFEAAFAARFAIERSEPLPESERVLYLMRRL